MAKISCMWERKVIASCLCDHSQKVNMAELKEQLNEERSQWKEEWEKAAIDLKVAVHRVQSEAQEELKHPSNAAFRHETEL